MFLQFQGRVGTGQQILDGDLRDLQIVTLETGAYLYTTTGIGGGLSGYALDQDTLADWENSLYYGGISSSLIAGSLSFLDIGSGDLLIFGGTGSFQAVQLRAQGQIGTRIQTGSLAGDTQDISAIASVSLQSGIAVYAADDGTGGLTTYTSQNGTLAQLTGHPMPELNGVVGMTCATVGGNSFLLTADQSAQGVSSFQINTSTGALTSVDTMGAYQGLGVSAPTAMEVIQAFGTTWVILAAATSGSLSVMRLRGTGELVATDHVIDTLHTRFGGVQSMAVVETEGRVFIVAGGADDGLSLFTLLPDGRLVHLQTIEHWANAGLMDVSQIAAHRVGDEIQVFVASQEASGLSQFTISLADLGATRTDGSSGGAGDDLLVSTGNDTLLGRAGDDILVAGQGDTVMTGGSGADLFVMAWGGHHATITDFEPANDRLDLSVWPMLRDPDQLTIAPTRWGAVITYQDNTLTIRTASGQPLNDIGQFFAPPDRVLVLGASRGQSLTGSRADDHLIGDEGADTINAGGGHDRIESFGGDDSIATGWGHDHITAGDGDDTIEAGTGDDTILGGNGNDRLEGEASNDEIWGGNGDDWIFGGSENDTIGGGAGHDTISGDDGADLVYAGSGNDQLTGLAGDDTIWGGEGHDLVLGGDGSDELGGGAGNDTLWGGTYGDQIWAGSGHDLAYGEGGDDQIGGGAGNDTLWGGGGDDGIYGAGGGDLIHGGAGDDEIWSGGQNDQVFGEAGNDTIGGGSGADQLWGGTDDDLIYGGWGNDRLEGEIGSDTLWGGNGADQLGGGNGTDQLWGGAGNDILTGGAGDDLLTGGGNADVFVFATGHGADRISDFTSGTDQLRILDGVDRFEDLGLRTTSAGLLIETGSGTILLEGLGLADLTAGDVLFV